MIVGVPREIKDNEYRVGMIPSGVRALAGSGHRVLVEKGAGAGSSIDDADYRQAGAEIADSPEEVYGKADLIVKVKEPRPREYALLKKGSILFTFLHLAADPALAQELLKRGVTAIGYETVELDEGALPILSPMSEVAGRLAVQVGAHCLLKPQGGRGVLLSGVPGVERGNIAIAGAGVVGVNAARIAAGLGADVLMLDTRMERFRYIDDIFGPRVKTLISNEYNIESALKRCDLLIGAVHVPGARTPRIITREMLSLMKKGAVIVDVSIDQGGCVETIRPTTHSEPTYEVDGVIHYGVTNMPGAVPRTSTFALTNATIPYILSIANLGLKEAVASTPAIKRGVNTHRGAVTHARVAEAIGLKAGALEL
ncbi:MAG: alanine dehydrogenase [Deltaproteobacteria bacterium]|nr:alanine dehydrogenase [Deltaproteobacteria bacterium]